MAKSSRLDVDTIPGERWEIALGLLHDGSGLFLVPGEVPVGLERYVHGPQADGRVHVSIFTHLAPRSVTPEIAGRDAQAGLAAIAKAEAADARLTNLFAKFGVVFEYVCDYDNGAVKIGDVARDGTVTML